MHGFRCCDNIAPNAKCQRVLVLALCLGFVVTVISEPNSPAETGCYRKAAVHTVDVVGSLAEFFAGARLAGGVSDGDDGGVLVVSGAVLVQSEVHDGPLDGPLQHAVSPEHVQLLGGLVLASHLVDHLTQSLHVVLRRAQLRHQLLVESSSVVPAVTACTPHARANSASCPRRDGKCVPAKVRRDALRLGAEWIDFRSYQHSLSISCLVSSTK